jgi:hypothetical protein
MGHRNLSSLAQAIVTELGASRLQAGGMVAPERRKRPWSGTEPSTPEWDAGRRLESQICELAEEEFGGKFVGT